MATAMAAMTAAASLQYRSFPSCLKLSSPSPSPSSSSSLSFISQSVNLRAQGLALPFRSQFVTQRFAAEKLRAASREAAEDEDEDEDEDELSLYEEELGFGDEEEVRSAKGNNGGNPNLDPNGSPSNNGAKARRTFRVLGSKEKKELRAFAHQLGNDICVHQVGKWGLTANCITAISDALEANELIKIRVLDNLDEELDDTASQLEGKTGAQIVGKIGRTLLLYRPSMRKLKAAQATEQKAYQFQKRKTMLASRSKSSRSFPGASRGKR